VIENKHVENIIEKATNKSAENENITTNSMYHSIKSIKSEIICQMTTAESASNTNKKNKRKL
jgi:hypothetical protein